MEACQEEIWLYEEENLAVSGRNKNFARKKKKPVMKI
jgi:hypothetical protein